MMALITGIMKSKRGKGGQLNNEGMMGRQMKYRLEFRETVMQIMEMACKDLKRG